jgi:hypothetical protein
MSQACYSRAKIIKASNDSRSRYRYEVSETPHFSLYRCKTRTVLDTRHKDRLRCAASLAQI